MAIVAYATFSEPSKPSTYQPPPSKVDQTVSNKKPEVTHLEQSMLTESYDAIQRITRHHVTAV
ncbi:MAG: hypothetical protein IJ774_03370 [Selenomonadaceae bacterium]|nr:hypothetical protein [Selenomonadaceae bacterium]